MRKAVVLAVAATLVLTSCTAQGGVVVTLDEYELDVDPPAEAAGDMTFTARNMGAIAHQLLVLRTKRPADDLPVDPNGVVLVAAKGIELAGEIPVVADGDSEPLSLALTPGDYALICNIAGHYANGMHAPFRVR